MVMYFHHKCTVGKLPRFAIKWRWLVSSSASLCADARRLQSNRSCLTVSLVHNIAVNMSMNKVMLLWSQTHKKPYQSWREGGDWSRWWSHSGQREWRKDCIEEVRSNCSYKLELPMEARADTAASLGTIHQDCEHWCLSGPIHIPLINWNRVLQASWIHDPQSSECVSWLDGEWNSTNGCGLHIMTHPDIFDKTV